MCLVKYSLVYGDLLKVSSGMLNDQWTATVIHRIYMNTYVALPFLWYN